MTDLSTCARPRTLTDLALRARCTRAEAKAATWRLHAADILLRVPLDRKARAWEREPVPFARSRAGGGAT